MKRIAHITDIHLEEEFSRENGVDSAKNWVKILESLKKKGITEIVFGGDIGDPSSHQWFFSSVKDFNFSGVLGNHDTFKDAGRHYNISSASQSELYYTKEDAQYKYIYLDSSTSKFSEPQQEWLGRELKSEKKIIIFIHHPILEVATMIDKKYSLEGREIVKEILQKSGKQITIFCGHLHCQDKTIDDNITQYVSFASCFQGTKLLSEIIIDNGFFGYRIIEFGDKIKTSLVCFDKIEPLSA